MGREPDPSTGLGLLANFPPLSAAAHGQLSGQLILDQVNNLRQMGGTILPSLLPAQAPCVVRLDRRPCVSEVCVR